MNLTWLYLVNRESPSVAHDRLLLYTSGQKFVGNSDRRYPASMDKWQSRKAKLTEKAFNYQNNQGNTALMFVPFSTYEMAVGDTYVCDMSVLNRMHELGAGETTEVKDHTNSTSIHYCLDENKPEILKNILKNVLEKHGGQKIITLLTQSKNTTETPLYLAAKLDKHHDCLKTLCYYWSEAKVNTPLPLERLKEVAIQNGGLQNIAYLNTIQQTGSIN